MRSEHGSTRHSGVKTRCFVRDNLTGSEVEMATLEELEERIGKIESTPKYQVFLQYLLAPLITVLIGAGFSVYVQKINESLQKEKQAVERIDVAVKMVPYLFSSSEEEGVVTSQLLQKVVDTTLADEIEETVARYYQLKLLNVDDPMNEHRYQVLNSMGGPVKSMVLKDTTIKRIYTAHAKEVEGFRYLLDDNFRSALSAFEESEKAYPTYHEVYRIANYIKEQLAEGSLNSARQRQNCLRYIVNNYSYRAPRDLLRLVAEKAGVKTVE